MYRDSAALQVIIDRVISSERPVQVSIRRNGDVHKMWRVSPEVNGRF